MNKIAELVRDSEIRGALAAFVDAGVVKVASVQAFDDLANTVSDLIGYDDYDLRKVAAVTDYVVAADEQAQYDYMVKRASLARRGRRGRRW